MDEIDVLKAGAPAPLLPTIEARAAAREQLLTHIRSGERATGQGHWRRRLTLLVAAAAIAALAAVGAYVLLTPRTQAGDETSTADFKAATLLITDWTAGFADCFRIPAGAVSTVEARLARRLAPEPFGGESPRSRLLPAWAARELNARRAALLATYASERYREAVPKQQWSKLIAASLAATPSQGPLIRTETRVLAVQLKRQEGDEALAWSLTWTSDITTHGRAVQGWEVRENRLLREAGVWKIDGDTLLGVMTANPGAKWGPYALHDAVDQMEIGMNSELYPGRYVPIEELRQLEALVRR